MANDADINNANGIFNVIGDPTEGALVTLAHKGNINKHIMNKGHPRIEEIPFDSDRKMMTTFHKNYIPGKIVSLTKGAPDIVIKRCKYISIGGEKVIFDDILRKKVLDVNNSCHAKIKV